MEPFFGLVTLAFLSASIAAILFRSPRQTVIVVTPPDEYESGGSGCLTFVVLIILVVFVLSIVSSGVR